MTLQWAMYYVSSHASARYYFNNAWWCHRSTLTGPPEPTGDSTDSQDLPQGGLDRLPRL